MWALPSPVWERDVAELKLDVFLPALAAIVAAALVVTPKELGGEMVDVLESSAWPVDTGYSKAHFGYRVEGDGRVVLTNEAEYAVPLGAPQKVCISGARGQCKKDRWRTREAGRKADSEAASEATVMADLPIVARVIDKTQPGLSKAGGNVGKLQGRVGGLGKTAKIAALAVAGIATAGIGLGLVFARSLAKGVTSLVEFEAELRPMVERSRIAAEALQVPG